MKEELGQKTRDHLEVRVSFCMSQSIQPVKQLLPCPYRIYRLTGNAKITAPPAVIEAESDDEALRQAKGIMDGAAVEIWQGTRLVGNLCR